MNSPRLLLLEVCVAIGAAAVISFCWPGEKKVVQRAIVTHQNQLAPAKKKSTPAATPATVSKTSYFLAGRGRAAADQNVAEDPAPVVESVPKTFSPATAASTPNNYRQAFGHAPISTESELSERPDLFTKEELEYRALQITAEADRELARLMTVLHLDQREEDVVYETLAHTSSYYVPGMQMSVTPPEKMPKSGLEVTRPAPEPTRPVDTKPSHDTPRPISQTEAITPTPAPPLPTPELVQNDPPPAPDDPDAIDGGSELETRSLDEDGREFWLDILESFDQKLQNGSN